MGGTQLLGGGLRSQSAFLVSLWFLVHSVTCMEYVGPVACC